MVDSITLAKLQEKIKKNEIVAAEEKPWYHHSKVRRYRYGGPLRVGLDIFVPLYWFRPLGNYKPIISMSSCVYLGGYRYYDNPQDVTRQTFFLYDWEETGQPFDYAMVLSDGELSNYFWENEYGYFDKSRFGGKKFHGVVLNVKEEEITLACDDFVYDFPLSYFDHPVLPLQCVSFTINNINQAIKGGQFTIRDMTIWDVAHEQLTQMPFLNNTAFNFAIAARNLLKNKANLKKIANVRKRNRINRKRKKDESKDKDAVKVENENDKKQKEDKDGAVKVENENDKKQKEDKDGAVKVENENDKKQKEDKDGAVKVENENDKKQKEDKDGAVKVENENDKNQKEDKDGADLRCNEVHQKAELKEDKENGEKYEKDTSDQTKNDTGNDDKKEDYGSHQQNGKDNENNKKEIYQETENDKSSDLKNEDKGNENVGDDKTEIKEKENTISEIKEKEADTTRVIEEEITEQEKAIMMDVTKQLLAKLNIGVTSDSEQPVVKECLSPAEKEPETRKEAVKESGVSATDTDPEAPRDKKKPKPRRYRKPKEKKELENNKGVPVSKDLSCSPKKSAGEPLSIKDLTDKTKSEGIEENNNSNSSDKNRTDESVDGSPKKQQRRRPRRRRYPKEEDQKTDVGAKESQEDKPNQD